VFGALRDFAQSLLGRGEATITVPSFDGALKPNQALENAEIVLQCEAPEDLASDGQNLFLADGVRLLRIEEKGATAVREFDAPITAICALPGGGLAVALGGQEVRCYGAPADAQPSVIFSDVGRAVNALTPAGDDALYATDGSATRDYKDWVWDLMERGRSGRALRLDLKTKRVDVLADRLRYAFGVAAMGGRALVAESWRHNLVAIGPEGASEVVRAHLPVYPSRLTPAMDGGWWLTAFAARTLLVEFVLREPAYRKRMMAEIAPEFWVAPKLRSGESFKEPMQGAHLKTMGVVKPWAPPRSYGLIIRLDSAGLPLFSLHSRVDGINHGIVAALEHKGRLYFIAKGPRRLLSLPIEGLAKDYSE
jgi:hypothetical protein